MPKAFAKCSKYVDKTLPSSNFSKKIFTDNGMAEKDQVVIPHGIYLDKFNNTEKYKLQTKKQHLQ